MLVGKPEGRPLGTLGLRWDDSNIVDLEEIGAGGV
jgi:hypothetical protein